MNNAKASRQDLKSLLLRTGLKHVLNAIGNAPAIIANCCLTCAKFVNEKFLSFLNYVSQNKIETTGTGAVSEVGVGESEVSMEERKAFIDIIVSGNLPREVKDALGFMSGNDVFININENTEELKLELSRVLKSYGIDVHREVGEIKKSFRDLQLKFHPDKNRGNEKDVVDKSADINNLSTFIQADGMLDAIRTILPAN
jgi:hypothetical protein